MTVLASISLKEVENYVKYNKAYRLVPVIKKNGEEGKPKKEFLFLNVDVSSSEGLAEFFRKVDPEKSVIKTLTLNEMVSLDVDVPSNWVGRVFSKHSNTGLSKQVIPMVEVEGIPNLFDLIEQTVYNKNIRFYGGDLLDIKEINIGRFDSGTAKEYGILGKEEPKAYFSAEEGLYDFFSEDSLSNVRLSWGDDLTFITTTVKVGTKKAKKDISSALKKGSRSSKLSTKGVKVKKVVIKKPTLATRKKEAFSNHFSEEVDF